MKTKSERICLQVVLGEGSLHIGRLALLRVLMTRRNKEEWLPVKWKRLRDSRWQPLATQIAVAERERFGRKTNKAWRKRRRTDEWYDSW
jgi:hypothetical protein